MIDITPSYLIAQAVARPDRIPALGRTSDSQFTRGECSPSRVKAGSSVRRAIRELVRAIVYYCSGPARRATMHMDQSIKRTKYHGSDLLGALTADGVSPGELEPAFRAMGRFLESAGKVDAKTPIDLVYRPVLALLLKRASEDQINSLKAGVLFSPDGRTALDTCFSRSSPDASALVVCIAELIRAEDEARKLDAPAAALRLALPKRWATTEILDACHALLDATRRLARDDQGCMDYLSRVVGRLSDNEMRALAGALSIQRSTDAPANSLQAESSLSGNAADNSALAPLCLTMCKDLDKRLSCAVAQAAAVLQEGHGASNDAGWALATAEGLVTNAVFMTGARQAIVAAPCRSREALLLTALKTQSCTAVQAYLGVAETRLLAKLLQASKLSAAVADAALQALQQAIHAEWLTRLNATQADIHAAADALLAFARPHANPSAVAHALSGFVLQMDAWNALSESMSTAIPESTRDRVSGKVAETIAAALAAIRHSDNPDGPLDAETLGRLADLEFGAICRVSGKLSDHGFHLLPAAVHQEMIARTEETRSHAVASIAAFARGLANPGLTFAQAAYGAREMTDAILVMHGLLGRLGKTVWGGDAFGEYVTQYVQVGLVDMPDDATLPRVVSQNLDTVIEPLLQALISAQPQVASEEIDVRIDGVSNPVARVFNIITASTYLLLDLSARLRGQDARSTGGPVAPSAALPPGLSDVLRQDFPFRYEASGEARSRIRLQVAKTLHDALAFLPDIQPSVAQSITVQGPEGEALPLGVAKQFHNDAILRSLVSFTVQGMTENGERICHRLLSPELRGEERANAMNDALWALCRLTGDRMLLLTAIMNQQLTGGLMGALGALGTDSPLQFSDGRIFQPAGAGVLHFDIVREPDGGLLINTSIRQNKLSSVTCISPSTSSVPSESVDMPVAVALNEASSRFCSTFSLLLTADGASMQVVDAVDFRYCLDEIDGYAHA